MPDVFTKKDEKVAAVPPPTRHSVSILNEKPHRPGLFSAFSPMPIGATFENQEPEEVVLLLLRRHFVTNLPWIATAVFLIILSFFLFPFLRSDVFSTIFFIPDAFILVLMLLYYLAIFGLVLTEFAIWFYSIGIVTNMRIVDVDFNSLLSRSVAFADIPDVVDVEIAQKGVLQGLFNYGTVEMQTEGIRTNLEFVNIPKPNAVADTISDLMREARDND